MKNRISKNAKSCYGIIGAISCLCMLLPLLSSPVALWNFLLPLGGIAILWIGTPQYQDDDIRAVIILACLTTVTIIQNPQYAVLWGLYLLIDLLFILFETDSGSLIVIQISAIILTVFVTTGKILLLFPVTDCINYLIGVALGCIITIVATVLISAIMHTKKGYSNNIREVTAYSNLYKQELHHDNLTGVYSRGWLMHNAQEKISNVSGQRKVSIAMIDIDHFKKVNDTYGHESGDEVLRRLGKLLKALQSAQVIVGRYGGEEFMIVFDNVDDDVKIMNTLRTSFSEQSFAFTNEHFTFSGGLHTVKEDESLESAIAAADKNLYYSKEHGRNQITA